MSNRQPCNTEICVLLFWSPWELDIRMPSSCCVIECTNSVSKVCTVRFYRIRLESEKSEMDHSYPSYALEARGTHQGL